MLNIINMLINNHIISRNNQPKDDKNNIKCSYRIKKKNLKYKMDTRSNTIIICYFICDSSYEFIAKHLAIRFGERWNNKTSDNRTESSIFSDI